MENSAVLTINFVMFIPKSKLIYIWPPKTEFKTRSSKISQKLKFYIYIVKTNIPEQIFQTVVSNILPVLCNLWVTWINWDGHCSLQSLELILILIPSASYYKAVYAIVRYWLLQFFNNFANTFVWKNWFLLAVFFCSYAAVTAEAGETARRNLFS